MSDGCQTKGLEIQGNESMQPDPKPIGIEIRPGVFRPDWSVVTTAAAKDALLARLTSRESLLDKWSVPLEDADDHLWRCALSLFVALGEGPSLSELGAVTGWRPERVRDGLQNLQERDLLDFDVETSTLLYAYPFAGYPTGHTVQVGSRVLNAVCAVDALGVGAMLQHDVMVGSRCRVCGIDIHVSTSSNGRALRQVIPADTVVWYDLSFAGNAATSCCQKTAFFCSDAHLQRWLDDPGSGATGHRLLPTEALEVGCALFGPLLTEHTAWI